MAAHRIPPGSIQLPFERAAKQIELLQLKDTQLHATILSLRHKIHNSRSSNCNNCRLYEQQITVIRTQEKEKAEQLERTLQRLQQENSILAQETRQLYARQQQEVERDDQAKERSHQAGDIEIVDRPKWPIIEKILDQHIQLDDIDDKTVTIQLREKKQQDILNKMKKRRNPTAKDNHTNPRFAQTSSHRNTILEFPRLIQENFELDPEISLQLKQLREKSAYLEQLCRQYEKSICEKDKMKEQDSLRIISQLQQIQNYKKELQNMDKHYQLECKQLQQQKENVQHELGLHVKRQENEINTMNKRIESMSAQSSNLTQELKSKHLQVFALNKNIADKDMELARGTSSLNSLKKDHQDKQKQLEKLTSELQAAQSHISQLSLTIKQQKMLNSALQQKNNTLLQQLDQLKHRCFALQAQSTNNKGLQADQMGYLRNITEQNKVILQSKLQEINHLQQELAKQQYTQKRLRQNLEEMFLSAQKNEMLLIQHKQKAANLENQKILIQRSLQNLQAQRAQISSQLQRQVQQKTTFSHKYLQQANKNVQICQKINALERQLEENKRKQMEALAVKQTRDCEFYSLRQEMQQVGYLNNQIQNDIISLKKQNNSLEQQVLRLEGIVKEREQQIKRFKAQNQSLLAEKTLLQESNTQIVLQNSRIIEQSTIEKQNLLNNIVKIQEDINTNRQLLLQRQSQIDQKDLQAYSQAQKIADLQAEVLKQREQSTIIQNKSIQLQKQIHSLNESLSQSKVSSTKKQDTDDGYSLKQQIRNKAYQLQELSNQLKQIQTQNFSLHKKHEALLESERKNIDNISYLNEKIDSLHKVYQTSTGQSAEELAKELNKKKQMIAELLTNFKYIEKALSKKQSQFDQLNEKHQKSTKATQKRNFQLESKLAAKESEVLMLKREKEEESKRNAAMIKDMERLTHQLHEDIKNKERIQNEQKRQLEREMARLTEEKKKSEQSATRQITHLKESLQVQRKKSQQSSQNPSPVKQDHSKKDLQILKKEITQKNAKIAQLLKQLGEKDSQLSVLKQINTDNQTHIKEISDMLTETEVHHDVKEHQLQISKGLIQELQQQIANLKAQLAKSQAKYHQLQNEDTEKNLAYDFLWIQLQQEKKKANNMQNRSKESGPFKLIQQKSLEITVSSGKSYFNHSSVAELLTNTEMLRQQKENEEAIEPPLSIKQQPKESPAVTHQIDEQVPLTHKKSSSKNILFQNNLSDVLSDSQQNDEINEMAEKDSDSKSHLQSSIQAFSEYSRIKSTKSELTHREVEQHYKSKMKGTMLLAKLGKRPKKK